MQGWVRLDRKITTNWLWDDKPFSKGQAWIDLLLLANHKENEFLLGNELIEVQKGSFITSERKLSERWGWSITKVRSFLALLENQKMLEKKSDNKKSTLTICNYCIYQDSESTEKAQKKHESSTKKAQKNTNKNDNNDNKDIKDSVGRFTPPSVEEVRAYCLERNNKVSADDFVDFYSSKGWMIGKNKMKDWKAAVRRWENNSKPNAQKQTTNNRFNQFPQRDNTETISDLESKLIGRRTNG